MKFDIIGKRYMWFAISLLIVIPGLISMAIQGFHLGIDFTGGTLMDLKFAKAVSVAEIRDVLKDHHLENSTIQLATAAQTDKATNVLVRTRVLEETERAAVMTDMQKKLGNFEILRIEKVGAVIGSELTRNAVIALMASWVLMIVYITWRFEFTFAVSAILSLIHDVLIVLGVFSMLKLEIDASFVAALMTIVGYSINDTIVIFDRIRENLKSFRRAEGYKDMVNRSIWQTMTRSIYTVLTVLFCAVALYLYGGETTKNFSFALIIGFASGAFSSIFFASPVWVTWKEWQDRKRFAPKTAK